MLLRSSSRSCSNWSGIACRLWLVTTCHTYVTVHVCCWNTEYSFKYNAVGFTSLLRNLNNFNGVHEHVCPKLHFFLYTHSFNSYNIKVKVKLSLCLTKHHAMEAYWGSGGIAPHSLRPWH
jgi:hypothetical protein